MSPKNPGQRMHETRPPQTVLRRRGQGPSKAQRADTSPAGIAAAPAAAQPTASGSAVILVAASVHPPATSQGSRGRLCRHAEGRLITRCSCKRCLQTCSLHLWGMFQQDDDVHPRTPALTQCLWPCLAVRRPALQLRGWCKEPGAASPCQPSQK